VTECNYRTTISCCAQCSGTGLVSLGIEQAQRSAVVKSDGTLVAALIGSPSKWVQCPQCLGSGAWQMNTTESRP